MVNLPLPLCTSTAFSDKDDILYALQYLHTNNGLED